MKRRHAICIVVDGLRASALGCYGNTVFPTPHLDELASRSVVEEWLWADSLGLPNFYRGFWQGIHSARPQDANANLHGQLHEAKVRQWLVTDDAWLSQQSTNLPVEDALLLETSADKSAETLEETQLAMLFSEAVLRLNEWLEGTKPEESTFLMLHTKGLKGDWDAPLELRQRMLDETDPEAIDEIVAPELLEDQTDPDVLYAYRVAYAAQVAVLDACIGGFYDALKEFYPDDETLVVLMGAGGFSLGEHGTIGWKSSGLYSENLHLPCLLGFLGNDSPMQRHVGLSQIADMNATLMDWFRLELQAGDGQSHLPLLQGELVASREMAVTTSENSEHALRTPAWFLTRKSVEESKAELYVKPDDLWEFNNVASLCPTEIKNLEHYLAGFLAAASTGKNLPFFEKDDSLVDASE